MRINIACSLLIVVAGGAQGQAVPPGSMSSAVPATSTVEAAHLSWRSYNDGKPELPAGYTNEAGARSANLYSPPGYKIVGAQNDPGSGFQAIAYQRTDGTGKTTIAFRGTETGRGARELINDLGRTDIAGIGMSEVVAPSRIPPANTAISSLDPRMPVANAVVNATNATINVTASAVGSAALSGQLTQAREFTSRIAAVVPNEAISFTGHSLGGAIAQVESARTGYPAETFNAPGMRQTVARMCADQACPGQNGAQIINHVREKDVVGAIGEHVGRVNGHLNAGSDYQIVGPDGKPSGESLYRSTGQAVLESVVVNLGNDAGLGQIIVDGLKTVLRSEVLINHDMQSLFVDLVDQRNRRRAEFDATARQNDDAARDRAAAQQSANNAVIQAPQQSQFYPSLSGVLAIPGSAAPPRMSVPTPVAIAPKPEPRPSTPRATCNKVYHTKDGCHPGHDEKSHPGGCRC